MTRGFFSQPVSPLFALREVESNRYGGRSWHPARAVFFHWCVVSGCLIWPGQRCEWQWDGSAYDPGFNWRLPQ